MTVPVGYPSSGTYSFAPSAADLVLNAFGMLQIRPHELSSVHLEDAAFAANMLMADISNRNPNRWLLSAQTVPLVSGGSGVYQLATNTISVTVAYIASNSAGDRVIGPMSAADYAAQPQKLKAGPPTAYWFSLATPPTITLWPVPDDSVVNDGGTLNLMTWRQVQDVDLANGQSPDCPYRFLPAFSTGLAAWLAETYRPEKEDHLNTRFEQRFARAQKRDQENVNISIVPELRSYFR